MSTIHCHMPPAAPVEARPAQVFNLFDASRGQKHPSRDKPRSATMYEVAIYLRWLAEVRGIKVPDDARYDSDGIYDPAARVMLLAMPGADASQLVTCEMLDDTGEVIRTITLPPKPNGQLPMTKEQAQQWTGLEKVKKARATAKAKDPAPVVETARVIVPDDLVAALASHVGYDPADTRDILPVIMSDGARRFLLASQLADLSLSAVPLVKANGEVPTRGAGTILRDEISSILPPREARRAAPAVEASPDVSALMEALAALAARFEALEQGMAARAAPGGDDGRDAYIATLVAERDEARAERDVATFDLKNLQALYKLDTGGAERELAAVRATVEEFKARDLDWCMADVRARQTISHLRARRSATAERLLSMRTTRSLDRSALAAVSAEVMRLKPVADAIAAMVAPPPAAAPLLRVVARS